MHSKRKSPVKETKFERSYDLVLGGRTITPGEIVKISGEHGVKFKFISLVTNKETGATWADFFELQKGSVSAWRSFRSDRIKPIPIKRGKRNVS